MLSFGFEVLIILVLILANGLFSMSEIAVVSARRTRLQHRAQRGDRRAAAALALSQDPTNFLSTIQVGITLVGVLTGAFGGATLARELAVVLARIPAAEPYARPIAFTVVVVAVTYLTLILGELVPKRLGLSNPERVAGRVAGFMNFLSKLGAPVVSVLSASTNFVLWLLRVPPPKEPEVSEDEIKILLRQGARAGLFEEVERLMVESVFRLADWRVGAIMTPRPEIEWIDPEDTREDLVQTISAGGHSHFPVADESLDAVVGVIYAKDLLVECLADRPLDLRAMARTPLYVPESMRVIRLLELFRKSGQDIALVIDEYGGLEGLVTLHDVLEAIVRDLPEGGPGEDTLAVRREDGSWLLDGSLPVDQFRDLLNLDELPQEESTYYQTLGGLVMMQIGHIPKAGEHFDWQGLRLEVLDMDGRRVDKVLASPIEPKDDSQDGNEPDSPEE